MSETYLISKLGKHRIWFQFILGTNLSLLLFIYSVHIYVDFFLYLYFLSYLLFNLIKTKYKKSQKETKPKVNFTDKSIDSSFIVLLY